MFKRMLGQKIIIYSVLILVGFLGGFSTHSLITSPLNTQAEIIPDSSYQNVDKALNLIRGLQEVKEFKKEVEDIGKSKPIVVMDRYPNPNNPYYIIQVYAEVPEIDGFSPTLTFGWYRIDPKTWTVMKMDLSAEYDKWDIIDTSGHECDNYTEITKFKEPIPIVWEAKFDGCMVSCWGAAFTRVPADSKHPKFAGYMPYMPDEGERIADKYMEEGLLLKISGKWTNIDADHVFMFDRKCVPSVEIEKIEIVK